MYSFGIEISKTVPAVRAISSDGGPISILKNPSEIGARLESSEGAGGRGGHELTNAVATGQQPQLT